MSTEKKYYTGIGSRKTPETIQTQMTHYAQELAMAGWMLRSGGASGADTAFQDGVNALQREIYLPWSGFNKLKEMPEKGLFLTTKLEHFEKASEIAKEFHKNWDSLKPWIQALHTRSVFSILGPSLDDPSQFVLFWAEIYKGDLVKGGTGMSVRVALKYKIPCFNLIDEETPARFQTFLDTLK